MVYSAEWSNSKYFWQPKTQGVQDGHFLPLKMGEMGNVTAFLTGAYYLNWYLGKSGC